MTDDDLIGVIRSEEAHTLDLSELRAYLIDRYNGQLYGNEEEGRSQVVSTDVADTIESMMPSLVKIFVGGDEIGSFDPVGPEDVEAAQQETDYTNWVITQQGNSFVTFYSWIKDALLQQVGFVKYWWDVEKRQKKDRLQGLSDDQLAWIAQDVQSGHCEIVAHTAYLDPDAAAAMQQQAQQLQQQAMQLQQAQNPQAGAQFQQVAQQLQMLQQQPLPQLHDIVIQYVDECGKARIECVPPEEVLVSKRAKSINIKEAPFVQHRTRKTLSALREMGFDVPDDIADDDDPADSMEAQARRDGESWDGYAGEGAAREVVFKQSYLYSDQDGDGIAELICVSAVGQTVLGAEEVDEIPFATISPILTPHSFNGRSVAELVDDIQLIKTTLLRQMLDNLYLANNGRTAVNAERVNLDDLLVSRPGGVVRVNGAPGDAMMPFTHPVVIGPAMEMTQLLDSVKEKRTGVTAYNQGLDANSLNKTATGITQIMSAAQDRMLLIARCFAETGVKDLFTSVHALIRKHGQKAQTIRLRNKWVTVDPREWKSRYDMTVSVGLGTGNKTEMLGHLQQMFGVQMQTLQLGVSTPQNIYQTLTEIAKNAGFKDGSRFFTEPPPPHPAPPPQPAPQVQAAKITADAGIKRELIKQQGETQRQAVEHHHAFASQEIDHQHTMSSDVLGAMLQPPQPVQPMQVPNE